ncbi:MAG: PAS domain S-box protein [Planctomycetales bacterium]|nr:PAS domain S-box protein [Planctomycetales bacterium]
MAETENMSDIEVTPVTGSVPHANVVVSRIMQHALHAAPCGILVVDQLGRILLVNSQLESVFGYLADELVGQPVEKLIPEAFREKHLELRSTYLREPLTRQMGIGLDLHGADKAGRHFPVEVGLNPFVVEGATYVMVTVVDISERVAMQEELRRSEERLAFAIRGTADGLWDWHLGTNDVWFSPRSLQLLGYEESDPAFAPHFNTLVDHLHADDRQSVVQSLRRHSRTGEMCDLECRLRTRDSRFLWFRLRGATVRDAEGRPDRMCGALQNIDRTKRYQEALEQSNFELEQFAYVASHDLQEPLRKVSAFCRLLEHEFGDVLTGDALTYLRFAVDGADRMQRLVKDLLSFSRVKSQGVPLTRIATSEVMKTALDDLQIVIAETQATITVDELPEVLADSKQMVQLFQNLIGNAIKYQRPGTPPVIHVDCRQTETTWTFSVADNGIGIEPQYFEKIFGIFKRLHGQDEYSGSGIGLAICRRIVERFGGRIWLESTPGHGSTFYFCIPVHEVDTDEE